MEPSKKVAIMQPYLFPYLGYFQLINAVDVFILYDDVNFIKQGWINRNQILNNNQPFLFTLPIESVSSFKKICDTNINLILYKRWKTKFCKLVEANYKKAPFFASIFPIIDTILNHDFKTISELNSFSIRTICDYLGISTILKLASKCYSNSLMERQERVIDICLQEEGRVYLNALGGKELYDRNVFAQNDLLLLFIQPILKEYKQYKEAFIPGLSIIDVLMFNGKEEVQIMLNNYIAD